MKKKPNPQVNLRETTKKSAIAFEKKFGSLGLLEAILRSVCRLLIEKGLITEEELLKMLNREIKAICREYFPRKK